MCITVPVCIYTELQKVCKKFASLCIYIYTVIVDYDLCFLFKYNIIYSKIYVCVIHLYSHKHIYIQRQFMIQYIGVCVSCERI